MNLFPGLEMHGPNWEINTFDIQCVLEKTKPRIIVVLSYLNHNYNQ